MTNEAELAFAEVIGEGEQTVLLLDHRGKVRAGIYLDSQGNDVSGEIGAALAGVGGEATRAMRHLSLGPTCPENRRRRMSPGRRCPHLRESLRERGCAIVRSRRA